MTAAERLYPFVMQARQQHGDGFLRSPAHLVPWLGGQAPDLGGEILALGSALEMGAAGLIAAAPDPGSGIARLTSEIAGRELLPAGAVSPALTVAHWIGPLGAAPMSGAAKERPEAPAKAKFGATGRVVGAVAAAALFFYYQSSQGNQTAPAAPIVTTSTGQNGQAPLLVPSNGNLGDSTPLPELIVQKNGESNVIAFHLQTRNGPVPGIVMRPRGGWEAEPALFSFYRPGGNFEKPDTLGNGVFKRLGQGVRSANPKWEKDEVEVGKLSVSFLGLKNDQEMMFQRAIFCILDQQAGALIGCDRVV